LDRNLPIGIFDSGVGGLTVYRALHERLPNERFVYLGDTAIEDADGKVSIQMTLWLLEYP
jgi:hypothetical protein